MRSRLHVGSLVLGMLGGAGLTLLAGAAAGARQAPAGPAADGAVGRYQLRATSRDQASTAFVVDTVTGEVYVVQEHFTGHVIKPEWGK
jgi:hypothetical protein